MKVSKYVKHCRKDIQHTIDNLILFQGMDPWEVVCALNLELDSAIKFAKDTDAFVAKEVKKQAKKGTKR
jgi:hypothetical protein